MWTSCKVGATTWKVTDVVTWGRNTLDTRRRRVHCDVHILTFISKYWKQVKVFFKSSERENVALTLRRNMNTPEWKWTATWTQRQCMSLSSYPHGSYLIWLWWRCFWMTDSACCRLSPPSSSQCKTSSLFLLTNLPAAGESASSTQQAPPPRPRLTWTGTPHWWLLACSLHVLSM